MSAKLRFTILGCGSSAGVPRIGGDWGACDPKNPKNRRRRCSMLVEQITGSGTTRILIDTGPDLREQLLDAGVSTLDAVVYTHPHADHVHGVDDLRVVVYNMKTRLQVYADANTTNDLISRFGYVFVQPKSSNYPPILDLNPIDGPIKINGAGGEILIEPFEVEHGRIDALGFRIGGLAYLPDVSDMNETAWQAVKNLDIWVLDALRRDPHPTHVHLEKSLQWIAKAKPKQAVLTNMHIDMDYATLASETPENVTPAYDGMVLEIEV
ncbi:MAG: MBL fold metallo-hydrolase [Rhodobacteraceae bacterium]|nr:MBL fold metallo-hydrolase [Paracoccaceae bacterium]